MSLSQEPEQLYSETAPLGHAVQPNCFTKTLRGSSAGCEQDSVRDIRKGVDNIWKEHGTSEAFTLKRICKTKDMMVSKNNPRSTSQLGDLRNLFSVNVALSIMTWRKKNFVCQNVPFRGYWRTTSQISAAELTGLVGKHAVFGQNKHAG